MDGICNYCKVAGHTKFNCPKLAGKPANQQKKGGPHGGQSYGYGGYVPRAHDDSQKSCNVCGVMGHIARNCPNKGTSTTGKGRAPDVGNAPQVNVTSTTTNIEASNAEIESELLDSRQATFAKTSTIDRFKAAKNAELEKNHALEVHELRPSFAGLKATDHVLTNHFTMELPEILHHYIATGMEDIADDPEKDSTTGGKDEQVDNGMEDDELKLPPSGKQRLMMAKLLDANVNLRTKKHLYATDRLRHVVSWTDPKDLFELNSVSVGDILANTDHIVRNAVPSKNLDAIVKNLKLKYKGEIHIKDLIAASNGTKAMFSVDLSSSRTIAFDHALNMIITKATLASSQSLYRIGSNKVYTEEGKERLAPGIYAHHGFSSSVKVGMGAPLLNIRSATSAFWEPWRVLVYLHESKNDYASLKDVKVHVVYTSGKTRTIKAFGKNPRTQMFDFGGPGEEISVLDYLRTKNLDENLLDHIAMSDYPCANTGTSTSPEWYPLEALSIAEHQVVKKLSPEATEKMLVAASKLPHINLRNIVDRGLATLGISTQDNDQSILHAAGITVSDKPVRVPAHKASFRHVQYGSSRNPDHHYVTDNATKWNLLQRNFLDTSVRATGRMVIIMPQELHDQDNTYVRAERYGEWISTQLADQMRVTGIQLADRRLAGSHSIAYNPLAGDLFEEFKGCFAKATAHNPELVILVNNKKTPLIYNQFKRVADQTYGMHTLCVVKEKLDAAYEKPKPYFGNIVMKVNIKLGNTNHTIKLKEDSGVAAIPVLYNAKGQIDTILLGADVTHAQKDSKETARSLAALVGSVDGNFGRFGGSVRFQTQNQEVCSMSICTPAC